MKYSDAELRNLAARATPLRKRWCGGIEPAGDDSEAAVRLHQWQHTVSIEGDPDIFARRIAFDGLDSEDCLASLGSVLLADNEPLPVWAERLSALLLRCHPPAEPQVSSSVHTNAEERYTRLETPFVLEDDWSLYVADSAAESLPFWDVWVPFVTQNTDELRRRAENSLNNLGEDALRTFQLQLLATLVHLAALPLSLEFRRFQGKHDPLSVFSKPVSGTMSPSHDLYRRFVRHLHSGGLLAFFQEYAVLARLMAEVAEYWAEHVAEFCRRLDEDRAALSRVFNHGVDLGPVVQVRIGISDPHHRRRDVVIPTFAAGLQIVYKPKDLGIDEAFWAFIHWLNIQTQHGEPLPLRTLTVLNRTTHGWVEFLEYEACRDPSEVQRYYRRIGMLLCVAYVLGGSDFHHENIIANGEQPALLDLETMLQPLNRPWDGGRATSADQRALEIMHDSVLRTGLLPFWIIGNPGKSYDVSGIGAEERFDTGYLRAHWENVNTDGMQVVYRSLRTETQPNRPKLNDNLISAEQYEAEIKNGFTAVYQLLLARRAVLLTEGGPLSRFRGLKLRYLLRMSKAYGQILNRRLHPEFLRNGADGSIEFERLTRDFLVMYPDPEYAPPWDIYRAEVDALERMDIPFFSFFSDSDALFADERMVAPAFFRKPALSACSPVCEI